MSETVVPLKRGLSPPLVQADVDLRGMAFMPIDVSDLLHGDFRAVASGDEFRARYLLLGHAWEQVPAGSLPDDDRILAFLSGAGAGWSEMRQTVLFDAVKCADGRLHLTSLTDKVTKAWKVRQGFRLRGRKAAEARWAKEGDAKQASQAGMATGHEKDAPKGGDAKQASQSGMATGHGDGDAKQASQAGIATGHGAKIARKSAENRHRSEAVNVSRGRPWGTQGSEPAPASSPLVSPLPPCIPQPPYNPPSTTPSGSSLRSDPAAPGEPSRPAGPASSSKPILPPITTDDPKTRLFREGLALAMQLVRKDEAKTRALLGRWLASTGDDADAVHEAISDAAIQEVADPVSWITARLKPFARPKAPKLAMATGKAAGPALDLGADWQADRNRARPWWPSYAVRKPFKDGERWCYGSFAADASENKTLEAARLPRSWPGDMEPLARWLHEGWRLEVILRVVREVAERDNYTPPRSLMLFDRAIRASRKSDTPF